MNLLWPEPFRVMFVYKSKIQDVPKCLKIKKYGASFINIGILLLIVKFIKNSDQTIRIIAENTSVLMFFK